MIWLLLILLCVLLFVFIAARVAARRAIAQSGLPRGTVLYSDTGVPVGRVGSVTVDEEGVRQEKPLLSRRHGLVGRPDYLVRTSEGIVPVEVKSARCPPGGRPHDSHVMQLAAYCLLVEDVLGERVPYGIIRYRDRELSIDYSAELKTDLLALLEEMREAQVAGEVHRSHEEARRCAACSMRELCDESMAL